LFYASYTVAKYELENTTGISKFPDYGIMIRLPWSKNVLSHHDAPWHIIFGADDPAYCTLLGLATWLEYSIEHCYGLRSKYAFDLFGYALDDPDDIAAHRIKEHFKGKFKKAIQDPYLDQIIMDENRRCFLTRNRRRASHSNRKFGNTRAKEKGMNDHECDYRGNWKAGRNKGGGNASLQHVYTDAPLTWVDAKVASALCEGGPIVYTVKQESGICDAWILENVVPNIRKRCSEMVSLVLGRSLLWRIFDENPTGSVTAKHGVVPRCIAQRVLEAYKDIGDRCSLGVGVNPVAKQPLFVSHFENDIYLSIETDDDGNDNGECGRKLRRKLHDDQMHQQYKQLLSMNVELNKKVDNLTTQISRNEVTRKRDHHVMNENIKKVVPATMFINHAHQQTHPQQQEEGENKIDENNIGHNCKPALLSKCPKTLHALWDEYEKGIGGNKAAKDFTSEERGKCTSTYSKRSYVWNTVKEMVLRGWDAKAACSEIYNIYGQSLSVTKIIDQLRRDSDRGGHPSLRLRRL
jgi:hypothetical protein